MLSVAPRLEVSNLAEEEASTATSTAPAQLRVTAESSTATAAQHSHLSQLSDGATLPLADTADTAESTDTV